MFSHASSSKSLDLSDWNTSSLVNINGMFSNAYVLESLDLSGWVTESVTRMNSVFFDASSLKDLDLSGWVTGSATDMSFMFRGASSLTSLDLSGWDTGSVMSRVYMFWGANSLASLTLGANTKLSGEVNLPSSTANSPFTGKWVRVGSAGDTAAWWSGTSLDLVALTLGEGGAAGTYVWQLTAPVTVDLGTGTWPGQPSSLASAAVGSLVALPASVPTSPAGLFMSWTLSNGTDSRELTAAASFVVSAPGMTLTANYDEVKWGDAPWVFDSDSGVLTIYGRGDEDDPFTLGNYGASPWNRIDGEGVAYSEIKKIVLEDPESIKFPEDSEYLFSHPWEGPLSDVKEIVGIGEVITEDVTNMSSMFYGVSSLESFDLSGWDTSSVSDMSYMFGGASALEELDLSGWDTSSVLDMRYMFFGAPSLAELDLSGWDTSRVSAMLGMFSGTTSLASLTLGEKTKLERDLFLPTPWPSVTLTGRWVRVGSSSDTSPWWSGTGGELIERSQNPVTAAGTYVWQLKAPVTVDLGAGTWASDAQPTNLAGLQDAIVGDLVEVPDADPVWEDHDFVGWQLSRPSIERTPAALTSFVVSEQGLALTPQWDDTVYQVTFDLAGGISEAWFPPIGGIVGEEVLLPTTAPTRTGYKFAGWLDEDGEIHYAGTNVTMRSGGETLTAQWQSAWGDAPWEFDEESGVLTVSGSGDLDLPYTLDGWASSPWNRDDEERIAASDIKQIVLADPESIDFPSDSSRLFSAVVHSNILVNVTDIVGIERVNTSGVTDMIGMFLYASSMKSLDLSSWDTSSVRAMDIMFYAASSLESLDVSGWDVSSVETMGLMFTGAAVLEELDFLSWDTTGVSDVGGMFSMTPSLRLLKLGENTKFFGDTSLGSPRGDDYTGEWVRLGSASDTSPWWSGTGSELAEYTQGEARPAGTYVWQLLAPVSVDLATSAWDPQNGPTNLSALGTLGIGDFAQLPNADPVRVDHDFVGWNLSKGNADPVEVSGSFLVAQQGLRLTPRWVDTVYRVTLDLAGGDPSSEFDAVEGIVGEDVTLPLPTPTRAGYRFATWEDQDGGVFGAGDSFRMPSGGIALTAKWQSAWGEAPWCSMRIQGC